MANPYGGSQNIIESTQQQKQEKSVSEILESVRTYSKQKSLQEKFGKLISTLIKEITHFSKDLTVEYHVVIFNEQINTRFTILESKLLVQRKKDEDSKENSYGAVGLLYNNTIRSNFLMIQFGYAGIDPIVYVNKEEMDCNTVPICALEDDNIDDLWSNVEKKGFSWAASGKPITSEVSSLVGQHEKGTEERKYAIAAITFFGNIPGLKTDSSKPLGAISLDFITKSKKYPNFAFRDDEISSIYHTLQNIKEVIELVILDDTSNSLKEIIKLALGEDK